MKRYVVPLLCLTFISAVFAPFTGAQTSTIQQIIIAPQPSRAIHIVYDDSASMINEGGIMLDGDYVDRWAQAKYALEVFAAMLDEKDAMRVYYMSDFDLKYRGKTDAPARITILGSEKPAQLRVDRVHNTVSEAWNTPYDTVKKAYDDLKKENADQKWLVVLTDGDFNQFDGDYTQIDGVKFKKDGTDEDNPAVFKIVENKVNEYFKSYVKDGDVRVIILAMGADVKTDFKEIRERVFLKKARNSNQILEKITEICNQIFNRNRYPNKIVNMRNFEFDLPMTELLVFVQGKDINVKSIKGGSAYPPNETANVRNSAVAALNHYFNPNPKVIPPSLSGVLARFRNIPAGKYSLEFTGAAENVEIYIKPEVNFQIKMYRRDNTEVHVNVDKDDNKIFDDIIEDNYRIEFGILNEKGNFFKPEILKDIKYTVKINGKTIQVNSGDTVKLTQGKAEVYAQARYLDITADDALTGNVSAPPGLLKRIRAWFSDHRKLILRLSCALLALLLIWLLWGTKKRFPKYMSKSPNIYIEREGDDNPNNRRQGRFKKYKEWRPLSAEEGRISFVPDDMLPKFRVRAKDGDSMILLNAASFTPKNLGSSGAELRIDNRPIREEEADKYIMNCRARIKTIFSGSDRGSEVRYTCHLEKE